MPIPQSDVPSLHPAMFRGRMDRFAYALELENQGSGNNGCELLVLFSVVEGAIHHSLARWVETMACML